MIRRMFTRRQSRELQEALQARLSGFSAHPIHAYVATQPLWPYDN